jgi:hypothetical protein
MDFIEQLKSPAEENLPFLMQGILSRIKSFDIKIIDESDISDYLIKHLDIIDVLPLVVQTIRKYAGNDVKIYMQACQEYYADHGYLLMLFRLKDYNDKNILEMIQNISNEYRKELAGKSGDILVTTDFVNYPRINAEASCFVEGLLSETEELPSPQASIRAIPALHRKH